METVVIDTLIQDNVIQIPKQFNNKRVKIIIMETEEAEDQKSASRRRLNFKIDETLEDVTPFADVQDTAAFSRHLRERHWR